MGEIHWIQASQAGVVDVFVMNPPKRIMGIVNAGAIVVAEVTSFANEEIKSPMPTAVYATMIITRYILKK